jgi:hypothetical protein
MSWRMITFRACIIPYMRERTGGQLDLIHLLVNLVSSCTLTSFLEACETSALSNKGSRVTNIKPCWFGSAPAPVLRIQIHIRIRKNRKAFCGWKSKFEFDKIFWIHIGMPINENYSKNHRQTPERVKKSHYNLCKTFFCCLVYKILFSKSESVSYSKRIRKFLLDRNPNLKKLW